MLRVASPGWARRALELAPADEPTLRWLMELLDRSGDRAGALAAHAAFEASLRRTYEVEPSPETQALAASIRGRTALTGEVPRDVARPSPGGVTRDVARTVTGDAMGDVVRPASGPVMRDIADDGPGEPLHARRTGARRALLAGVGLVLALAAALPLFRLLARAEPALEPRRVLVVPFDDMTRDASLEHVGRMTADWITDGVARMGGFEVVTSSAVWAIESAPAVTGEGGAGAGVRRIARETGAGTVLSGSYYVDGGRIILQARMHDAASGRVLRPVGGVSIGRDSLVHGIDVLRTRVLAALAPVGDTVFHLRMAAPPPSWEAYHEYITGMVAFVTGSPAVALRHYERAAAADDNWAMPRIAAAIMHMNLGSIASADSILAPLDTARHRLGPLEHGTLRMVLGMMRGDQRYTYDAVMTMARIAPGTINEFMVGEMARKLNRPAEAIAVLEGMGPERGELRGWTPYWRELAYAHHMRGDHTHELDVARRARVRHPHAVDVLGHEVRALAALGRVGELLQRIDERIASASGAWPDAGELMRMAASELRWHGHTDAAAEIAGRAVAWHEQQPRENAAARVAYARALIAAGRSDDAARVLRSLSPRGAATPFTTALLAFASAGAGHHAEARALADEAGAWTPARGLTGPLNTMLGDHTVLRAATAAFLGDADNAVRLLRQAEADGLRFSPDVLCNPAFERLKQDEAFRAWSRARE